MATNCPQQVKPRAWRSALCLRTADSNSKREKSCNICENMLHTRFTAEPPEFVIGSGENSISNYQKLSFFRVSSRIHNLDKSDRTQMERLQMSGNKRHVEIEIKGLSRV